MSFLPTQVLGVWCYLYFILDIYSRKIVGFEVHESDDSDHAVELLRRTALAEGLHSMTQKPVLHGDNGSTLKATGFISRPSTAIPVEASTSGKRFGAAAAPIVPRRGIEASRDFV